MKFLLLTLVAAVFCFPQPGWAKPVSANFQYKMFREIALPNSSEQIWVVGKCNGVATSYYSSDARQKKFATGSYIKDLILNGKGGKTNCGKKPRVGTLSANYKKYPPGTWLRISRLDTGEVVAGVVEDTGKKMKQNARHVDIYMGKGEKALYRSLAWGKQNVVIEKILVL